MTSSNWMLNLPLVSGNYYFFTGRWKQVLEIGKIFHIYLVAEVFELAF